MNLIIKFLKFIHLIEEPLWKDVSIPLEIYWLKHPHHIGQKWYMALDKHIMLYGGETFKLTYEYYKYNESEFEIINPEHKYTFKMLNT
jgi:hypothetical protein